MFFTPKFSTAETENESVQYPKQKREVHSHSHIKNLRKVGIQLIPGVTLAVAFYVNLSITVFNCCNKDNKINPTETWFSSKPVLFDSDFDSPNELKGLLSESWNAATFDRSG